MSKTRLDTCSANRCNKDAEFNIDGGAWRTQACTYHLGVLVQRRVDADGLYTVTVARVDQPTPVSLEPRTIWPTDGGAA